MIQLPPDGAYAAGPELLLAAAADLRRAAADLLEAATDRPGAADVTPAAAGLDVDALRDQLAALERYVAARVAADEDALDLAVAAAREAADSGARYPLDEAVAAFDAGLVPRCACPHVRVGGRATGTRNWSPACPVHGVGTAWYGR